MDLLLRRDEARPTVGIFRAFRSSGPDLGIRGPAKSFPIGLINVRLEHGRVRGNIILLPLRDSRKLVWGKFAVGLLGIPPIQGFVINNKS
jgi:hypothetical protein